MQKKKKLVTGSAMAFIFLMGIVSLFSDMTHEGARSIIGAYLTLAGASAAAIGFVSGLGEFLGYSLRLVSGFFADKTKKYWPMTIVGYIIDVMAIPALALVPQGGWKWACALMLIERIGKAIKKPAKDTLLSFAASQEGAGKSFALQELLDQIGAFLGPVILFLVLYLNKTADTYRKYALCFAVLGIPAIITVVLLLIARRKYPNPEEFEPEAEEKTHFHFRHEFFVYIVAISFFALGFIDFPIITMHTAKLKLVQDDVLPLLYAGAMAVDAVAALIFGWLYDRIGVKSLMLSTAISALFPLFIFGWGGQSKAALFIGIALWGVGMGAQESTLKAAVCTFVPKQWRSSGFGVFETAFGVFWFLGSWLTGVLYDQALTGMIIFSILAQVVSIVFLGFCHHMHQKTIAHKKD